MLMPTVVFKVYFASAHSLATKLSELERERPVRRYM